MLSRRMRLRLKDLKCKLGFHSTLGPLESERMAMGNYGAMMHHRAARQPYRRYKRCIHCGTIVEVYLYTQQPGTNTTKIERIK